MKMEIYFSNVIKRILMSCTLISMLLLINSFTLNPRLIDCSGKVKYIVGYTDSVVILTESVDYLQTMRSNKLDMDLYDKVDSLLNNYNDTTRFIQKNGDSLFIPLVDLAKLPFKKINENELILYITFTNCLHYMLESHKARVFDINNKEVDYYSVYDYGTMLFYTRRKQLFFKWHVEILD